MKRKLTTRELFVFGLPVLGLMVGIIGYFILVSPQKSKANELATQIAGAQVALVASHQKPVIKHVSAHAVELFRLTTAMPDSADVPGLLLDLTRLSQASGVTLQSVIPQAEVPASGYGVLPVNITIGGTFPNVSDFLGRLRKQVSMANEKVHATGRLVVANEVELSSTDGRTVTATLDLDAFYYGTSTPTPTAPAVPTTTTPAS